MDVGDTKNRIVVRDSVVDTWTDIMWLARSIMYSGLVKKSASWTMHMDACATPVKLRPSSRIVIDSSYATMRQKRFSVIELLAFKQPRPELLHLPSCCARRSQYRARRRHCARSDGDIVIHHSDKLLRMRWHFDRPCLHCEGS